MRNWSLAFLLPAGVILSTAVYFVFNEFSLPGIELWLRNTARISFVIFTLAFSASALQRFWKISATSWLLKNRKELGVAFALVHFLHLGLLGVKGIYFEAPFEKSSLVSITGGIITYFFIGIMLLTSFHFFSSRISVKLWSRIHTVGGYTILFVFTVAYIKHSIQSAFFIPFLVLAISVWVLRFMNLRRHATT